VPYWDHLAHIEKLGDGLLYKGQPISLTKARQLWKRNNLEKWEEEWASYQLSKRTHYLFPTVESRLGIKWFPYFYGTRALSGHGHT